MPTQNKSPETFIGNGPVYMAPIVDGVRGQMFWVGEASSLTFSHEVTDKKEMFEHHTGDQVLYDTAGGKKKTSMSLTLHERKTETLKIVLKAEVIEVAAQVDKVFVSRDDLVDGSIWSLGAINPTVKTIMDSSEPPVEVPATNYTVNEFGLIEFLTIPEGTTMPLTATVDTGVKTVFKPMTSDVDSYYMEYHCKNIAGQGELSIVKAYRVNPDPASAYDLINEDFSEMTLEGECLYDTTEKTSYVVER